MLFSVSLAAQSQETNACKQATDMLRKLREAYTRMDNLSFDVKYRYTSLNDSSTILDSMEGQMMLKKQNYRSIIGNTETIGTDKYTIMLFKQDSVMYLAKPSMRNAFAAGPSIDIDTLLSSIKNVECSIHDEDGHTKLSFDFPPGGNYQSVSFIIDIKAMRLLQVSYILKTILLMDIDEHGINSSDPQPEEYSRLNIDFVNYSTKELSNDLFDDKKFFYRENKQFKTTDAYSNYRIVLGTANL